MSLKLSTHATLAIKDFIRLKAVKNYYYKQSQGNFRPTIKSSLFVDDYFIIMVFFHRRYGSWLKDTYHHHSLYTTVCWTSALALVLNAVALFVAYLSCSDSRYSFLSLLFPYLDILLLYQTRIKCMLWLL